MNPETEKNVNEAIDWLQKTGGSIQDFAVEQAPLYCREVVAWELWSNAFGGITSLILFIGIAVALWRGRAVIAEAWDECDNFLAFFGGIIGIVALVPLAISTCSMGHCALKAAVAPRLVIVEHLRSLK